MQCRPNNSHKSQRTETISYSRHWALELKIIQVALPLVNFRTLDWNSLSDSSSFGRVIMTKFIDVYVKFDDRKLR